MNYLPKHLGLPLLTKELIEQSARKRTYILRVLYALVLYGTTLWAFQQQFGSLNAAGLSVLGHGRSLYISLAWLEFGGIYIFLPAMTCGVLTSEKERDTLGLLLLTKLGPWTIVFEKLLGRLVPMGTFVFLSLPLLAIGYSLGGVEVDDISKLMWVLAATALQVGSFAVLCSAWFRTTAGAFLATYLLGALAVFGSGIFYEVGLRPSFEFFFRVMMTAPAHDWLFTPFNHPNWTNVMLLAFGPFILNGGELSRSLGNVDPILPEQTFLDCVVMTVPMFATSLLSLTLARAILWRRAFVQPGNIVVKLFRSLDGFFQRVNQNRLTRGIVLIRESVALPRYHPISWRETSKRSLGTTRYLIRMLLMLEIPVIVMALWPTDDAGIRSGFAPAYITEWSLWLVATLVLAIQSTGLIGMERSRQSLDVLLTIPMESEEIVRQKFAGIWRMIFMLWFPFTTIYTFQIWCQNWVAGALGYGHRPDFILFHFVRALLAVGLYLPTIAWFGFYQGLRYRSQTQAILVTMTIIVSVCVVPLVLAWSLMPPPGYYGVPWQSVWFTGIVLLSPAAMLVSRPGHDGGWLTLIVHFLGVAAIWLWLSYRSRKGFAKRVGRNDGVFFDEEELPVAALSVDERLARVRRGGIGNRGRDDLSF